MIEVKMREGMETFQTFASYDAGRQLKILLIAARDMSVKAKPVSAAERRYAV